MNILFDLDGTLIDSLPDIQGAANATLSEWNVAPLTRTEARGFVGLGVPNFVRCMAEARGLAMSDLPAIEASVLGHYVSAHDLTELFPGVRACLETLLAAGHSLAICTNKPEAPARAVLDHLDLTRYFAPILGGDTISTRKPNPDMLFAAASQMPQGRVCLIGDSDVDAATAQAADMPFLLFTEGYRKAPVSALPHQAAFSRFSDLPALINAL